MKLWISKVTVLFYQTPSIESLRPSTFYRTLQEKVRDENLKTLLDELAGEEIKHRKTLETFLLNEPGELGFNTERDSKVADTLETPPLSADLKTDRWPGHRDPERARRDADVHPACCPGR